MKKTPAWIFRTFFIIAVGGTLAGTLVAAGVAWHFSRDLPKIIAVEDYRPLGVTKIIVSSPEAQVQPQQHNEQVIGEFYKERRYLIPFEKIPENVIRAFISAEDDQFFAHSGINIASILRASIANFRAGHVVQGGSTITQQVAKSLVLTSERSFVRKIKEVIVASRIERNLSKQQILYLYLNQIYLGHGAYGVQAATQTYFKKDVSEITVAEAALLAGLPQAPSKYSPILNPKKAKDRQLYVLRRMFENKFITQAEMSDAATLPLKVYRDEDINKRYASYWVEHLRRYLTEKYGEKAVYEDALTVIVPGSAELMRVASKSLRDGLEAVDKRMGFRGPTEHLASAEDIEKKLRDIRAELLQKEVGFELLMPEGRMDSDAAMKFAGIETESQLLKPGKTYRAVVTSLNDRKKSAGVMVGATLAELSADKMSWALGGMRDAAPSKILQKGDVILVRVEDQTKKPVVVSLDQRPELQGAILSIDATTGYVLAMEGGYDFEHSEFNRAIQALRQPGSAFKPIIYSAALERGFTPASVIVDSPIIYEDSDSGKWKPANFDEKFHGDTTFRQALIKSRNVPTIKLVQSIQVSRMIDYAKRIGISSQFPLDLSIALGSATVSLMDLTRAYALFPRMGRKVAPGFFMKIFDRDGQLLEEQKPQPSIYKMAQVSPQQSENPVQLTSGAEQPAAAASFNPLLGVDAYPLVDDPDQVLDPRVAYVMSHLMKEVVAYGTGHEAKSLARPAAGKTGTTNDFLDAWFMGFTPQIVTGVWVGYDGQKTMGKGETGARAALPIWVSFMKEAVKPYAPDDFVVPPGVVFATIDPHSGKLAPPNSSNAINEAFIEGTEPKESMSYGRVKPDPEGNSEYFKEDLD
ncbi:MAG TPA: penicillin-binding protein [Bdellovibrionales bacterium]|nr:MAG: hypothetical protein A2Z97_05855 [Bdellovibrionales bacterium GWB1_52_6]OFZ04399.1 MAG: hypothetical protein A2X97_07070 [Bdellovibrionales bacterium GWA1_52_35]HAR42099.1 penicillin-binding protein [Bdellovibrionales bacterium]HCM40745.1 penicillin-binding protein [Bdellovibrionales bacterium]